MNKGRKRRGEQKKRKKARVIERRKELGWKKMNKGRKRREEEKKRKKARVIQKKEETEIQEGKM